MHNDIVILIPSYEPDEYLIKVVTELHKLQYPVLVVNDGSSNKYDEAFNSILPMVKYLKFDVNHGKGDALKEGYKNIPNLFPEAKYVISADGDGQHAIKDIEKMYALLKEHNELVLGVRLFDSTTPFKSRFGNEWSKLDRGILTKQYLEDDQCGLRGFPIRYLDELIKIKGHRYDYELNQLASFQLRQYRIITMPIEIIYIDSNRRTHFAGFKDTFRLRISIVSKSLPAVIGYLLTIGILITLYHFGYIYYHLLTFPIYIASSFIYILLLHLFEKTHRPIYRLFKELYFSTIKATFVFLMLYLFIDAFKLSYYIAIPLLVTLAVNFNLIIPRFFKKQRF